MKIYFSHGKESGPKGDKIRRLTAIATEQGFESESIDYTEIREPDKRAEHLLKIMKGKEEPYILVGSSMGGYVSLVSAEKLKAKAIFLLAPALYLNGYNIQTYKPKNAYIEIVHGWSDNIVPVENSFEFSKQADCTLHLISGDHRLMDSIETVEKIFRQFLINVSKLDE